jgi:predicted hydrolase (HD superfamily)
MTIQQAHKELHRHLTHDQKVVHSRVVAQLMRGLAAAMRQDVELWEIVGLCRDLDDIVTKDSRRLHGIMTAQWLADDLPHEALDAIKAHDHRTGFQAETKIADYRKLADALAVADDIVGREAIGKIGNEEGRRELAVLLADKPSLLPIIADVSDRLNLSLDGLVSLFENALQQ